MKKHILSVLGLLISTSIVFSGCSASDTTSKTEDAFSFIENQEYEEALSTLEDAITEGEDEREIFRARGIALLGQCDYAGAIEAFEKSLSLSNGILKDMDYDINYYLATAYGKSGNVDEAIKIYDSILLLRPEEVDALYLRGILYAGKDELDSAMSSFDKAISLAPDDYGMLINIYTILEENGYKEVGQNYLKTAMESGTKKMTNYEKGQISFYLEDYESARTYLEKAREENGAEAVLFLGRTYETLGDTNYAISVYSSFINSGETSPEVLNQMGLCKMKMADYEGALSAFQQAMNSDNNGMLQTLKFNEIVAYEYIGDFKKACVLLEGYMRAYPDDKAAQREYLFLKTR